jgi:hypothetical protein
MNQLAQGFIFKAILKDTQNEEIKNLFLEWKKLDQEWSEFHRKCVNRKNDKGRNEKFEKNMLDRYLGTPQNQS